MADRFYCSHIGNSTATLTDSEAHHAIHVMRLKAGGQLQIFDGAGTTVDATIDEVGRKEVTASINSRRFTERRSMGRVTVAASIPKGYRLKWMVEKLTEVGVDRFIPLQAQRSVVAPGKSKLQKLSATVIGAAKQCRRDWLMEIEEPQSFNDLVSLPHDSTALVIAHPSDEANTKAIENLANTKDVLVLIGPEGGFTDEEMATADAKLCGRISWSGGILRTETAAIVMATLMMSQRALSQSGS